jgi:hypothetical protein
MNSYYLVSVTHQCGETAYYSKRLVRAKNPKAAQVRALRDSAHGPSRVSPTTLTMDDYGNEIFTTDAVEIPNALEIEILRKYLT